jgi:hypothetical protein
MTDLGLTIAPVSNQLNADDLQTGPRTVTITKVSANPSSAEQPIAVSFKGDEGKPYLPCKVMRRVMVNVWGRDGNTYPGRSMTLYRDDKVRFGGLAVGGIRISHMSGIDKDVTMALTETRGNKKPFTVKPLKTESAAPTEPAQPRMKISEWLAQHAALFEACEADVDITAIMTVPLFETVRVKLTGAALEQLDAMIVKARARIASVAAAKAGVAEVANAEERSVAATNDEIPFS